MLPEPTRDALLFHRLRQAGAVKPKPSERFSAAALADMAPYLADSTPLHELLEPSRFRLEEFCSFREQFFGDVDFALARIPQTKDLISIRADLVGADPGKAEESVQALRAYRDTHPGDFLEQPLVDYLLEYPPGAVFCLKFSNGGGKGKDWSKYAKAHGFEDRFKRYGPGGYAVDMEEQLLLYFGAGFLYPAGKLGQDNNLSYPGGADRGLGVRDIPLLVRTFKQAKILHGERWAKESPEGLRLMERKIALMEWEDINPLWDDMRELDVLEEVKVLKPELKNLAFETNSWGNAVFSWPMFLKQLWDEEPLLRAKFEKIIQTPGDRGTTRACVEDPAFRPVLVEMGKVLMPFAPAQVLNAGEAPESHEDQCFKLAEGLLREIGCPEEEELKRLFVAGVTKRVESQWDTVKEFRGVLAAKIGEPDVFEQACALERGVIRDFFLFEAWKKEPVKNRAVAETYLRQMRLETPEGAKANRATDLMTQYVRNNIAEGTVNSLRLKYAVYRIHHTPRMASPDELAAKTSEEMEQEMNADQAFRYERYSSTFGDLVKEAHVFRKQDAQQRWKQGGDVSPRSLYVFSDAVSRQPDKEVVSEKAFSVRIIEEIVSSEQDKDVAGEWAAKWMPEASVLRDFYLENALHEKLWRYLQGSRLKDQLAAEGITCRRQEVDLHQHFAHGKDDGALQDAYFTRYTLVRVEGLATKAHLFDAKEKADLVAILRDISGRMTAGVAEGLERLAIELEADRLRVQYEDTYQETLPRGRHATQEEEIAARDKAFHGVFSHVVKLFPYASYNRDELLERFALDYAVTADHMRIIEDATYTNLVRKPQVEKKKGEKVVFGPVEQVKNYLAVFQDRESRSRTLSWIFQGEVPDDRYLEGAAFGVNADEEREAFWAMSQAERKVVLYNALLGDKGLFEVSTDWNLSNDYKNRSLLENQAIFLEFIKKFYDQNFAQLIKKEGGDRDQLKKVLETVFIGAFKYYSPSRRVELFLAVTKKMHELRTQGKELTAAQAIRLFLEQVGVVGIKAGQVIAEQKDLGVDPDIRQELSSVRDRATPFAKSGIFTYLRVGGLLAEKGKENQAFGIVQVGKCLGSASIKQAHKAWTTDGREVVVKAPRPTIEKNFEEDVQVLEKIFADLVKIPLDVPEFLLPEIVDACRAEFDFSEEAATQQAMDKKLYDRKASVQLEGEAGAEPKVRLDVPDLIHLIRKGEGRVETLQLMVDEYVPGLSLAEAEEYQGLCKMAVLDAKQQTRRRNIEEDLNEMYHEHGQMVAWRFAHLDYSGVRAQLALDLICEVTTDGIFHADEHAGNVRINLDPRREAVTLIDFGSAGRSVEVKVDQVSDYRPDFRDFVGQLLLLQGGFGDSAPIVKRLGEILETYVAVPDMTADAWAERVQVLHDTHQETGPFFKGMMEEILSRKGKINREFKMLLKAFSAAGGHFDALKHYLVRAFASLDSPSSDGSSVYDRFLAFPGMEKLKPVLESMPSAKALLAG
ncbi:AarF/ABC1/UbiB kinase family protein [Patescibacteria group bacterium]|nr:AarF/ABC1/UbiB kinase family protein [Patescibacteria group bacterium]